MPQKAKFLAVRDIVLAAILAGPQDDTYAVPTLTADKSHLPLAKITDPITKAGRVWVIASGNSQRDRKTRPGVAGGVLVTQEVIVQVAFQQSNISPDDIESIDNCCLQIEQLQDVVKDYDYYNAAPQLGLLWTRNESLRDENGLPFHYYMIREGNIFESYFYAYFIFQTQ